MKLLFAHISWMPRYSGKASERIFSTHGWVLKNNEAHERSNFKVKDGILYGYVPIREKLISSASGQINIGKLGAEKNENHVDGVTVVWFANNPSNPKKAYVVGWYRNATVFRDLQFINGQEYRFSCGEKDATLLSEKIRKLLVPHIRSPEGQKLGFGYGQSSIWYVDKNAESYRQNIEFFINYVDSYAEKSDVFRVDEIASAIDDLYAGVIGSEFPERRQLSGSYIVRDNNVRHQVVIRADGRCEHCGEYGFQRDDKTRFVEAHHIISLANQGPDTLENVIALCPNHHREAHFGIDRVHLEKKLTAKLAEIRGN